MSDMLQARRQAGVDGEWVCVGALGAPHGVKGALRLKSFTENTSTVFRFAALHQRPNGPTLSLRKERSTKDGFIVRVDGINSPEAASALKGQKLYVPRSAFGDADEDEYYLADLIGLIACDSNGARIGLVQSVENFGAEDLIELQLDTPIKGLGRYAFIPFRKTFVPDIDIAAQTVTIQMTEWLETQVVGDQEQDSTVEDKP